MSQKRIFVGLAVALLGALLRIVTPVHAASTAAQRCQAAKMLAAGTEARAQLVCARRSLATGADAACRASAAGRRATAFARAEARGGCVTTGDSAEVGAEVDALYGDLLAALRPGGPAASRCTEAQLGAAARAIAKLTQVYTRVLRTSDPNEPFAAIDSALVQLRAAFERASRRGDCLSGTTKFQASDIVAEAATRLLAKLRPACGDGVRAGDEVCDGTESGGCLAGCTLECTCTAPYCGNQVVEPGEQCDGATCPDTTPGEYGCSSQFSSTPCACCAVSAPCYVRGFGNEAPLETPCCSGVCEIPGPEAGPDVVVHCTVPPASCPCWTSASLDATFPPGYFDEAGRGGAECDAPQISGIATADTCFLPAPVGGGFDLTRAGAVVVGSACALFADLDPGDGGYCSGPPLLQGITQAEAAACIAELQASTVYQTECP